MDPLSDYLKSMLAPESGRLQLLQVLLAIAFAYAGGILSSLTPCVYPMIPITVSAFGGLQQSHLKRPFKEVSLMALVYLLGMTCVYSFLGVLAGLTGQVFGSFTNTYGWYLTLGTVLTIAALIMTEVVPFDPIVWWHRFRHRFLHFQKKTERPSAKVTRELTLMGVFGLGATSGLIGAPCTTPVLTAILAFIAATKSVSLGLILMISFSLGLGTLLVLIAVFTGMLRNLPRSGHWLRVVKVGSGLVLLFLAEYLFYLAGRIGG